MPEEKKEKTGKQEAQEEWKVRFKDGTVFSPVTYDTLLEWFKSGQIDAETPVAKNHLTAEWVQLKKTEGFAVTKAAKEGRQIFCTSCGAPWPEGTKFCTKCGTNLQTGEKVLAAGAKKPQRVIRLRRKAEKVSPELVEPAAEEVPPQAEIQAPPAEQAAEIAEAGVLPEVAPAAEEAPEAAIPARQKKRGKKKVIRLLVAVAAIVVGLAVFAPEQMSEILRKAKRLVGLQERGPGEKEKEKEEQKWVGVRADVRSAIDSVRERISSALTTVPFADRQKEAFETEAAAFLRAAADEFTDTDAFVSLATALADGELREAASFLEEEKSLLKAEGTTPGIDAIQGAIQILLGREKKGLPLLASAVEQSDIKPVAASFCRGAVEGCLEKLLLPQGKQDPWGSVAEILGVNKDDLGEEFLARHCGKALLGMTALQGLSWTEARRASAGPAYRLASQNTSTTNSADGSTVVTRQLRVILSGDLTEPEIRRICNEIIAEQVKFQPYNAISLSFYLPGTSTSGPPTGGAAIWAPDGTWQNAGSVRAGDYSRHRLLIQPAAGAAAVSPFGTAAGKPGGSPAGMFSRLTGAQAAGSRGTRIPTKSVVTLFRRSDPSVQAALVELGKTDPAKRPSVLKHKAARVAYALSLMSRDKRAEPGRDNRLLSVLTEGLSADPENAFYDYALAAVYLRMKKDAEAIAEIAAGNNKPVCRDYSKERMAGLAKVLDTTLPYTAAAMAISSPHLSALASSTRRLLDSAQSAFRVGKWAEVFEILGQSRIACVKLRNEACTFSDALTVINAALPVMAAEAEFYKRDGKAAEAWRVRKTLAENWRLALAIEQAEYGPYAEIFVKEVLSEKGYEEEFSKSPPQKVLAGLWSKATGRLDAILGKGPAAAPMEGVNLQDRNYVAAKSSLANQKHEMAFQYANACLAQNPKHLWAFKVMQEAAAKASVEAEFSKPKAVAYTVMGKTDLSLGGVKRIQYEIAVAKGTTKEQAVATARSALQGFWKREKADAVRIYVTPKGSLLPLVRLNWAPGGDWAKAKQDTPYSEFEEELKVFGEGRP